MTLVKVSDRNLFRANQNYSNSFRYLYPSKYESFWTNPKNFLYLVWWKKIKNRSDQIRFNPRQQSGWIQNQIFHPNRSELGLIQTEFSIRINTDHSALGFIRINSDWKFARNDSDWKLVFGLVRIHSDCYLGLNRIRSNRFFTIFHQTRYKKFFVLVQNDSHWLGYRYRNESE